MTIVLLGLAGYVLGSLPWGYWLSRFFTGKDIREVGSRGTGAANVWRHAGFKMFFAVALLDIGKGSAAAALGLAVGGPSGAVAAGTGALIGHWRPLFLGFKRGGKIVATTVGVALVIAPLASVVMAVLWWMVLLATRYTSVASITASLALPPLVLVFGGSWSEAVSYTHLDVYKRQVQDDDRGSRAGGEDHFRPGAAEHEDERRERQ